MKTTTMKIRQPRPKFLDNDTKGRSDLVKIPWIETSGHPNSPYAYNNGVHAALHSLLTAMKSGEKEHVQYWLETAQRQLDEAVEAIKKPRAKVPPSQPCPTHHLPLVTRHFPS